MLAIKKGDLLRINLAVALHLLFVHKLFSNVEAHKDHCEGRKTTENQTSGLHNRQGFQTLMLTVVTVPLSVHYIGPSAPEPELENI